VKSNYIIPSQAYFAAFDQKLLSTSRRQPPSATSSLWPTATTLTGQKQLKASDINPFSALIADCVGNETGVTAELQINSSELWLFEVLWRQQYPLGQLGFWNTEIAALTGAIKTVPELPISPPFIRAT
jgi:hypothetical protein